MAGHRTPQETARQLAKSMYVGAPLDGFDQGGRLQLQMLLAAGLYPWSKVVDIGCGALRGGFWLIHFLDAGCYHGLEPDRARLEAGLRDIVGKDVAWAKRPRFDHNHRFDTSVFATKFDFFLARGVWSHAAKADIEAMLDAFARDGTPDAVFLASFCPASWLRLRRDYHGPSRLARTHVGGSDQYVFHSTAWIRKACAARGLTAQRLKGNVVSGQRWLRIRRRDG